jgi:hypothetical protein
MSSPRSVTPYTPEYEQKLRDVGWAAVNARLMNREAILAGCGYMEDAYNNDVAWERAIHAVIGGPKHWSPESVLISYLKHTDPRMNQVGSGLSKGYSTPQSDEEHTKWQIANLLWLQDGLHGVMGTTEELIPSHPQYADILRCMSSTVCARIRHRLSVGDMKPCGAHGYNPDRFYSGLKKLQHLLSEQQSILPSS